MAELNCTNKQNYTIHGVGSMDLHGVAELNCTNKQNYTIHGVGSMDLHGVAELNCTNKQNYTIHGVGSAGLHGVAELNCTNKQNYTIHGVGSAGLHGVAELNCTNKQNNTQNQTCIAAKLHKYTNVHSQPYTITSKQLHKSQHNTIHVDLMHEAFNACVGTCECSACLQKMINQVTEWMKMMQRCV